MPLHDWTRVNSGLFHHFHQVWSVEIWSSEPTTQQNRLAVSYESTTPCTAYLESFGIGDVLPKMPLFISPGAHVLIPLEEAYLAAWDVTPKSVRTLIS